MPHCQEKDHENVRLGRASANNARAIGICCFFRDNGDINGDKSLETLCKVTVSRAAADMVAPSNDGRPYRSQYCVKTLDDAN